MPVMWGIHNDALGAELVEKGFVSIGWNDVGDLRQFGPDRERLRAMVTSLYPGKPKAVAAWTGVLYRFAFEMTEGDLVVAPYRPDSTLNFGVVDGPYEWDAEAGGHRHRRRVRWLRTGVARAMFPQAALNEIGAAVTLFRVKRHEGVFRRFLDSRSDEVFETDETLDQPNETELPTDGAESVEAEINADRIEQDTLDFIARVLLEDLSHEEFEHFTAALLRTMGYEARVTPYSRDGGVDVLAHKDPLGVEPPLIKVQCKHTTVTQGAPAVQQLIGSLASSNEVGLFVSLGTYSHDAIALERGRHNLRLFGGGDITRLTVRHYADLPSRWRDLMPLRPLLVVDRPPESR